MRAFFHRFAEFLDTALLHNEDSLQKYTTILSQLAHEVKDAAPLKPFLQLSRLSKKKKFATDVIHYFDWLGINPRSADDAAQTPRLPPFHSSLQEYLGWCLVKAYEHDATILSDVEGEGSLKGLCASKRLQAVTAHLALEHSQSLLLWVYFFHLLRRSNASCSAALWDALQRNSLWVLHLARVLGITRDAGRESSTEDVKGEDSRLWPNLYTLLEPEGEGFITRLLPPMINALFCGTNEELEAKLYKSKTMILIHYLRFQLSPLTKPPLGQVSPLLTQACDAIQTIKTTMFRLPKTGFQPTWEFFLFLCGVEMQCVKKPLVTLSQNFSQANLPSGLSDPDFAHRLIDFYTILQSRTDLPIFLEKSLREALDQQNYAAARSLWGRYYEMLRSYRSPWDLAIPEIQRQVIPCMARKFAGLYPQTFGKPPLTHIGGGEGEGNPKSNVCSRNPPCAPHGPATISHSFRTCYMSNDSRTLLQSKFLPRHPRRAKSVLKLIRNAKWLKRSKYLKPNVTPGESLYVKTNYFVVFFKN